MVTEGQYLRKVFSKYIVDAGYQKQDYNYDALTKNHLPGSQKDTGQNYGSYNDYSDQKGYGNKRTTDPY